MELHVTKTFIVLLPINLFFLQPKNYLSKLQMRYTNFSARLNDDVCALKNKNLINSSINDNDLYNYYFNKNCDCPVLDEIAMENNFTVREGYGYTSGCTVDKDSELRLNSRVTHDRSRQQLCSRTYGGVPNLNKGGLIPNIETRLKNADDTSDIRNLDKIMEKSFVPLSFVPMIDCLSKTIQNPENIIPEWRWGGNDTRQDMVSNEYLTRCGFDYMNKNWVRRESM
jgi:hypothetical protein